MSLIVEQLKYVNDFNNRYAVITRYRNGIRGHLKDVLVSLIHEYLRVEVQFQLGSFDKCVIAMRDQHKTNVRSVVDDVLSHASVAKKNLLVVQLIVSVVSAHNRLLFIFSLRVELFGWAPPLAFS